MTQTTEQEALDHLNACPWYVQFTIRGSMNLDRLSHQVYDIRRSCKGVVAVKTVSGWQHCSTGDVIRSGSLAYTV